MAKTAPVCDQQIASEMLKRIEDLCLRTMLGGWPLGYEPGRGMPGTLRLPERPSRYGVIADDMVIT